MPYGNQLLNALPVKDLHRLEEHLSLTPLRARQILHWPGQAIDYVYFIEDGLVSVLASTGNDLPIQVWLIGREGLVGLPAILDGFASPHRRVVELPGHAFRIRSAVLKQFMHQSVFLNQVLLRYVQANLIQASQSGACAARHSAKQRIARWLLLAHDRVLGDQIPLTHSLLSRLLGVRRATVTVSLGMLEKDGSIRQRRGMVVVTDRERLQRATCICYGIIASAYESVPVSLTKGRFCDALSRETATMGSRQAREAMLRP